MQERVGQYVGVETVREREKREREREREREQARAVLVKDEHGDVKKVWKDFNECFFEEAVMFVGKHEILLDNKDVVVEQGGCGLGKGEAASVHSS